MTDFHETWYEHHSTGGYPTFILLIPYWQ